MSNKEFNDRIEGAVQKARAYLLSKYKISEPDLDDILQDASLKALKAVKSFKGKSSFDTWFVSICRNEALAFFRKTQKHQADISKDEERSTELSWYEPEILQSCDIEERAFLVNQALSKLSEKHREIIQICLNNAGSSKEIADMLKIPINSARTRLHYAKKRLKKLIETHAHESNLQFTGNRES